MGKELISQTDGFGVPENSGGQFIKGQMLKFIDGNFVVDKTEPLSDEPLVAIGVVTAWVKWGEDDNGNKRPHDHKVTAAGQIHPDVDDMPDRDDSLWPPGLNGEAADPWKDTRYLHLVNPRTGGDLTFITDSFGGRRGVGNLKSKIMNIRMAYPGAVPVVKCTSVPFKTSFGMKKRPEFEIMGWRNQHGGSVAVDPQPQLVEQLEAPKPEIDDDIPF
jgi:hypothetical protein